MTSSSAVRANPVPPDGSRIKSQVIFTLAALWLLSACGSGPPPAPPNLQLSTTTLTFDLQLVGTKSAAHTETLTNTGGSKLDISGVSITGTNSADFSQTNACGSTLGPGASCSVSLSFTPSQIGQSSASMSISDNGVESAQTLSLSGLGGAAGPNATLSPASWDFGTEDVGQTSGAVAITLTNFGTESLDIASLSASTNFAETDNCTTLSSGESCTINASFTPDTTGTFNGSVSVVDNALDSPQTVALTGMGGSSGSCQRRGVECYSGHPCCPGLVCVPASVRAFCEPAGKAVTLRERF